ncbi:hypothetical protein IAT38_007428 [Cryptococcus sp. DSM 104549]
MIALQLVLLYLGTGIALTTRASPPVWQLVARNTTSDDNSTSISNSTGSEDSTSASSDFSTSSTASPLPTTASTNPTKDPSVYTDAELGPGGTILSNGTIVYLGTNNTYIEPQIPSPLNATYAYDSSAWSAAHQKAADYLADWTIEEKATLVSGGGWQQGRCAGNIVAVPSKGFKGLCLQDGPAGVRFTDFVTAFPAGINAAATFDKDLIYARAHAMGKEFKAKGVHVALTPMTNMGRVAAGGRNWEGFGADPYLSGWATELTIRGVQDAGVQACVKHFVGNEQEHARMSTSSNIDDRAMREIYTHPFLRAIQADVASVMCSYNQLNGTFACENPKALNGILKTDFGFRGYVMTDWFAAHESPSSANTGLDMTMPGLPGERENIIEGTRNGTIEEGRLDDMAQRIMAAYYLLGQDNDYPDVNYYGFSTLGSNNSHIDVREDHDTIVQHMGAASTILLKNVGGALPLNKPRTIALIGSDHGPSQQGPNGYLYNGGLDGTLTMGWGSGSASNSYIVDPLSAISAQAKRDRTAISWWLKDWELEGAATTATEVDVAIVSIASDSGEDLGAVEGQIGDRDNLTAWHNGDELVKAVAAVNNNTVVVVHSVGPMLVEEWIDHPNVTAVLWAGLPGQESGNSLVDILYGWYNPSGRLPYTIAKERKDYGTEVAYVTSNFTSDAQVDYTEGLFIDYRHFQSKGIEPRFPFGYGLSYTSFELGEVSVNEIWGSEEKRDRVFPEVDESPDGPVTAGRFLTEELQAPRWTVTLDVTNTGGSNGCEIPQLYLAYPKAAGEPPKVLRDFARVNLDPGATQTVSFNLSRYDVSIWDVVSQDWVVPDGEFGIEVGKSSADSEAKKGSFCPGSC